MKTVERVIRISGEDKWVDETLAKGLLLPERPFYRAAYGYIQEVSRRTLTVLKDSPRMKAQYAARAAALIAETQGGKEAFEASGDSSNLSSVAKCRTCNGSGMVLYDPGPNQFGEMCPDCDERGDAEEHRFHGGPD